MIRSAIAAASKGLEARLAAKARLMGEARARSRKQAQAGLGSHWRKAGLLWPLFTTDR